MLASFRAANHALAQHRERLHTGAVSTRALDNDEGVEGEPGADAGLSEFFGAYQILNPIGRGGLATVVRARHIHPSYADRSVALKILDARFSADRGVRQLFVSEAYLLSLLEHPNIVRTFEAGEEEGRLFIAMEAVHGRDLSQLLRRAHAEGVHFPRAIALHVVGEVLRALVYAHALRDTDGRVLRLVHRDVNPSNVLVSYNGHVKLSDFGVARVVTNSAASRLLTAGKLGYFAPEQIGSGEVDHRADVFACGVMIYELVCGERPFAGSDEDATMRANREARYVAPKRVRSDVPDWLAAIMERALQRKPRKRYADAGQLLAALAPHLPDAQGARLGLGALVRQLCFDAYLDDLRLRESLERGGLAPGQGVTATQTVALCSARNEIALPAQRALEEAGYNVSLWPSVHDALLLASDAASPRAMIVDLTGQADRDASVGETLRREGRLLWIVGLLDDYDPVALQQAAAYGVDELLVRPFSITHLQVAARAAALAAQRGEVDPPVATAVSRTEPRLPVLLVGSLAEEASTLEALGHAPRLVADVASAVAACAHASPRMVALDGALARDERELDQLITQFRSLPGMGVLPMLLVNAARITSWRLPARCCVLGAHDDSERVAQALRDLAATSRDGRAYVRYATHLTAELRSAGRSVRGNAADLSRGGLLLYCAQMPPLGTEVGVTIELPDLPQPVEAQARVVRVHFPDIAGGADAGIGVRFERFAEDDETLLIEFITKLAARGRS